MNPFKKVPFFSPLSWIKKFRHASEGVAAVEFALILPVMLLMFMGSIELGDLITVNKRIAIVSDQMGDLVARTDTKLSQSVLNDYFSAVSTSMTPYDATKLKQVVTCLYIDDTGKTKVIWSEGYNGGSAHVNGATFAVPSEFIIMAKNRYVVVAEASLNYLPLFGYAFETGFNLYRDSYYLPRFGGLISIIPT